MLIAARETEPGLPTSSVTSSSAPSASLSLHGRRKALFTEAAFTSSALTSIPTPSIKCTALRTENGLECSVRKGGKDSLIPGDW